MTAPAGDAKRRNDENRRADSRVLRWLAAVAVMALCAAPTVAFGEPSDVFFLVDGSGSISDADWALQKDGISAALRDRTRFPADGSVAVGVVQWSFVDASFMARVEIPLTAVGSDADRDALVGDIQAIQQIGSLTNPGDGIRLGTEQLLASGAPSTDWVLCMSTDGTANAGEDLASAVAFARSSGVDKYSVVAIEDPPFVLGGELAAHYGPHVFGGGSVTVARNTAEFASLVGSSCLGNAVELRALEVNQAVQDWHNAIALVEDKPTAVRAFVQTRPGDPDQTVVGRLYGKRGGADLPGSPLLAINPGSSALAQQEIASRRATLAASLNFVLPLSWRSGTVELRFEAAGTPVDCKEPSGTGADPADDCKVTVTFTEQAQPRIAYVSVPYMSGGSTLAPTTSELFEQMFRSRTVFPAAGIDYATDTLATFSSQPTLESVNSALAFKRLIDTSFLCLFIGTCRSPAFQYYGVITGDGGGLANGIPGTVSSGFLSGTGARSSTGYARNRGPHEQGHVVGRHHAVDNSLPLNGDGNKVGQCGEIASASAPGHSPFETVGNRRPVLGTLNAGSNDEVWGLDNRFVYDDAANLAVVDPRQTFELMSYCGGGPQGRWISQFTYEGVMGAFPSASVSQLASASATGDFVIVRGTVDFSTDMATLQPASFLAGATVELPAPGAYRVQLLGGAGTELAGTDFQPIEMDADVEPGGIDPPPTGLILVPVEKPVAPVARIAILHGGVLIGSADASPSPPTVSITAPADGAVLGGTDVTFEWHMADPDGGAVFATVLYSADDGSSWNTLAVDQTDEALTMPRSAVAGSSTARIRVIVSDGVNTAQATSDRFEVANSGPTVDILSPLAGQVFSGVQAVVLEGVALDREEGALDHAIAWSSSLDGLLGSGQSVALLASDLSEGTHEITASATDAGGETGTDTITIRVFRIAPSGDTTPPVVTPPADVIAAATGPDGAFVSYPDATAVDDVDGPLPAACLPPSASLFALGTTVVTCTAEDAAGNTGEASFQLTVQDTTPPVVTVPGAIAVDATSPAGAVVTFDAWATDTVDGTTAADCEPPSGATFPIGDTTVRCGKRDASGNLAVPQSFTIHVRDGAEQIERLRALVASFSLHPGVARPIDAHLRNALRAMGKRPPNKRAACAELAVVIQKVTAQAAKAKPKPKLSAAQAAAILDAAKRIRAVTSCCPKLRRGESEWDAGKSGRVPVCRL